MVNPRFQRAVAKMGHKEFLQTVKQSQKTRPDGMKVPDAALIPPSQWKSARDLPFAAGDRVQIVSGNHKNKIGQILYKYPFGNAFAVNGISSQKMVNTIETKLQVGAEDYEPVSDVPTVFDVNQLRLVSKMKTSNGEDVDVAIHSVSLGAEQYDPVSNQHRRRRYATYDESIQIPWPTSQVQPVEESKNSMTTNATVADTRTYYVISAIESPMPMGAIPQITNLNNRFRRSRYAQPITQKDIEKHSAPQMPTPPKTVKLLEDLALMPKSEKLEFTAEMKEFIGAEIRKGLAKRLEEEKAALKQYT